MPLGFNEPPAQLRSSQEGGGLRDACLKHDAVKAAAAELASDEPSEPCNSCDIFNRAEKACSACCMQVDAKADNDVIYFEHATLPTARSVSAIAPRRSMYWHAGVHR